MSSVKVREAKRELHKAIIDIIYSQELTIKEEKELFRYVIELGANELAQDWEEE
jgi:hypothetical protein